MTIFTQLSDRIKKAISKINQANNIPNNARKSPMYHFPIT
ncbi:hypothetical protein UM550_13100 [Staphylococcus aureus]|nr:hypothetical protein UM550_13100 [Staphylococcus aureus]WRN77871.1 hypothetical protein UM594_12085 [Staphylococcus aureus]